MGKKITNAEDVDGASSLINANKLMLWIDNVKM